MNKKCTKCNRLKPLSEFHLDRALKDGHRNVCKKCAIKRASLSQKTNRDKRSIYMKAYAIKNKSRLIKLRSDYYQKTKSTLRKEYKERNRIKLRKFAREYESRKSKDPIWRLRRSLRARLNRAIHGSYRTGSAVSDLGCSIQDFKAYIEKQFKQGMTWKNWGRYGWHLDHIIPLSHFDLRRRDQLKRAAHYSNIQPLWWHENLSKLKKLPERSDKEPIG